jgi:monofunctional biosynthetic peptidoglycan transglycosylase
MHGPGRRKGAGGILRLPRVPKPLRAAIFVVAALIVLPYLITPFYAFGKPVSTIMIGRWLTGERVERTYVPISRISSNLVRSVIAAEDGRFCSHYGVDLAEIRDAIEDADSLDEMRGGSTITQQVAKNLFLSGSRTYLRKGQELILAYMIEWVMPKRRILEIYLNIAEWGVGVFGAQAAAEHYYGTSAARLSTSQAARLAAMLPNPRYYDKRGVTGYLARRAGILQRRMQQVDIP